MRPSRNYIVLRPIREKSTAGGLVVPGISIDPSEAQVSRAFIRSGNRVAAGVVVAVGPGVHDEDDGRVITPDVDVGETVLYCRGHATAIEWPGEDEAVMVREEGIYFAVEDGDIEAVFGGFVS